MDIVTQLTKVDWMLLIIGALLVNLGTLGFRRFLLVCKKIVNQATIIPVNFDLAAPMTFINVLSSLIMSLGAAYITLVRMSLVLTWYTFGFMVVMVFFTSFVTWYAGLGDAVELIPAALQAAKRWLNNIGNKT